MLCFPKQKPKPSDVMLLGAFTKRRETKADLRSVDVDRGMVRKEAGCGLGWERGPGKSFDDLSLSFTQARLMHI